MEEEYVVLKFEDRENFIKAKEAFEKEHDIVMPFDVDHFFEIEVPIRHAESFKKHLASKNIKEFS